MIKKTNDDPHSINRALNFLFLDANPLLQKLKKIIVSIMIRIKFL